MPTQMGPLPENVADKIGAPGDVPTVSELGLKYREQVVLLLYDRKTIGIQVTELMPKTFHINLIHEEHSMEEVLYIVLWLLETTCMKDLGCGDPWNLLL
jgi:hypothetical protein